MHGEAVRTSKERQVVDEFVRANDNSPRRCDADRSCKLQHKLV